jgi:hypothetical protein
VGAAAVAWEALTKGDSMNGWQRLWVVVSVLYLILVSGLAALFWPTAAGTQHREEFIALMPAHLQAHVDGAHQSKWEWEEAWKKRVIPTEPKTPTKNPQKAGPESFTLLSEPVTFPNGAVLDIHVAKEGDKEPDERVAPAYWAVVEAETRIARWTLVWQLALLWLVPCLTLYALGSAVAWVRRGFRRAR